MVEAVVLSSLEGDACCVIEGTEGGSSGAEGGRCVLCDAVYFISLWEQWSRGACVILLFIVCRGAAGGACTGGAGGIEGAEDRRSK